MNIYTVSATISAKDKYEILWCKLQMRSRTTTNTDWQTVKTQDLVKLKESKMHSNLIMHMAARDLRKQPGCKTGCDGS